MSVPSSPGRSFPEIGLLVRSQAAVLSSGPSVVSGRQSVPGPLRAPEASAPCCGIQGDGTNQECRARLQGKAAEDLWVDEAAGTGDK